MMDGDGRRAAQHVRFLASKVADPSIASVLMGCADVMDAQQQQIDHLQARLYEEMELGEYDD